MKIHWVRIFFSLEALSVFAIFRSLETRCKGQVLTFQKLPLMSQDKNHLVHGFFFSPVRELQARGGMAHHPEIAIGGFWTWLTNWIYTLLPIAPFISHPPMQGSEKEILLRRGTERW